MNRRFSPFKITRTDTVILVFACLFFTAIVQLALSSSRDQEYRMTCRKNLSVIGKAMQLYANDYEDEFPRAGGRSSFLSDRIADFTAPDRYRAFQIGSDGRGGFVTISSSLYLLIKYTDLAPKLFVCPGDSGATVFNPADDGIHDKTLQELWDFGRVTSNHYSYAYHKPFGQYVLTISSNPDMAVLADKNPWLSPVNPEPYPGSFDPDGDREAIKAGNSFSHDNEGQNVLFVDGHVGFETQSFCGVDKDNIYTYQDGKDIRMGGSPKNHNSTATGNTDSYLVNEPGIYKKLVTRQSREINSSDLKQTSIVATLDCPMPEHRNVIWCSTFKMAWDKMKDNIIGEPIRVIGAEELAARLNNAKISPTDLNEDSYYATAGFVEKGIIEQIHAEMKKRFPSEPVPVIGEHYKELPNPILAYSYLNVDMDFEYPFYTYKSAFGFVDSSGVKNNVTAFCGQPGESDRDLEHVRGQVDILYYEYGEQKGSDWFAVDLCRHTQPYQVVLALVPRCDTLGEAVSDVEKKISEFKLDPDYDKLRKLRPKKYQGGESDELIIPDVFYKLKHHFKELKGKSIGNQPWRNNGYFIFEAMQMIDFSLSRTGVVLKSEGIFGITSAIGLPPRYFHFNKPFLIYVKKRGDDYRPFFVMWVDNVELMNLYQDN
jgi:prepilin-type processing-associated H-X9-DG protein